ncbi:thrombospondin type 3 repeat-containing protein [Chloroflexota bacterium]
MTKQRVLLMVLLTLCLLLGTTSCQELEERGSTVDTDGDGWTNGRERIAGTDPNSVDTDGDGYWDPHDPNPLDPNMPVGKGLPKSTSGPTNLPTPEAAPSTTPAVPATSTLSPPVSTEMAAEELPKVQAAVKVMMTNNNLTQLAYPVRVSTNDMHRFPDDSTRHGTAGVGYVLYLHDWDGDGRPDTNYISFSKTKGTYICDEYGNVTQVSAGHE